VVANTSVGFLSAVINGTVDIVSATRPEGVILGTNEGCVANLPQQCRILRTDQS